MTSSYVARPGRAGWPRLRPFALGSAALLAALVAGCTSGGGPSADAPTGTPSGAPATATPTPIPVATAPPSGSVDETGCATRLQVTAADSGHTVCLHTGATLTVVLGGAPGSVWRPVTATGPALTRIAVPPGQTYPAQSTVDAYRAVKAGAATLASSRPLCPPPQPGSVACQAVQAFTLHVTVR